MSSGGSNYSTGTTGNGPMTARIESPISKGPNAPQGGMSVPVDSFSSPAPGGKGGFPSAQSPYAQQQPQVYMPPQQPTMYQQAFPQQYSPYSYRNAYARPYSYSSPIQARPPIDEMNYAPGGLEQAPQQLMSDSWRRRPGLEYAGPTSQTSQTMPGGGLGGMPKQTVDPYQGSYQISEIPYQGGPRLTPVAATQGVRPEPNYSGGLGSLMSNSSNPAYMQQAAFSYGNSEEARRNSIQRQLNDAFTASQKAGKSILESAREQDEISARLHAQYGLKPYAMSSG